MHSYCLKEKIRRKLAVKSYVAAQGAPEFSGCMGQKVEKNRDPVLEKGHKTQRSNPPGIDQCSIDAEWKDHRRNFIRWAEEEG